MRQRKQIRLKEYNYASEGVYFVTVCVKDRQCLFGDIVDGKIQLNEAGKMVENVWNEIPNRYGHIKLDYYVIMPDHFHGIIIAVGAGSPRPLMMDDALIMLSMTELFVTNLN